MPDWHRFGQIGQITFSDEMTGCREKREAEDGVYLDFSKACDVILL